MTTNPADLYIAPKFILLKSCPKNPIADTPEITNQGRGPDTLICNESRRQDFVLMLVNKYILQWWNFTCVIFVLNKH